MQKIIVKKSKIDKKGVFANKKFKKGEIILIWKAKHLKAAEVKNLSPLKKHYVFKNADNKYFLMQPPEKYVNHSCNPNTKTRNQTDVAIRDIKKGEEITSDYTRQGSFSSFICTCGSEKCRGFIKKLKL